MLKIQYSTPESRENIIADQAAQDHELVEEHNIQAGNFLLFDDDVARVFSKNQYRAALASDVFIQKLKEASFSEIDDWVDNNITSVAAARVLFKKMLMVMSYLLNKTS